MHGWGRRLCGLIHFAFVGADCRYMVSNLDLGAALVKSQEWVALELAL